MEEVGGTIDTIHTPGISQRKAGVDRWFHSDWIGSSRYLTDGTGLSAPTAYRFDAYGNRSASAGPDSTTRRFAGDHGYEDDGPAGLQMLGHRFYDPAVGRFLNPDPIGFAGGLNLYAYCGGDPVEAVDPSGLDPDTYHFSEEDELRSFGRFYRATPYALWNSGAMRKVNDAHARVGSGRFGFGDRWAYARPERDGRRTQGTQCLAALHCLGRPTFLP